MDAPTQKFLKVPTMSRTDYVQYSTGKTVAYEQSCDLIFTAFGFHLTEEEKNEILVLAGRQPATKWRNQWVELVRDDQHIDYYRVFRTGDVVEVIVESDRITARGNFGILTTQEWEELLKLAQAKRDEEARNKTR
jgi:hypothetical protein